MIANILVFVTGSLFLVVVESVDIIGKPQSLTVKLGNTATLQCDVRGDISTDPLEWTEFISKTTGSRIFYSGNEEGTSNPAKYEIEGTYNLKIKNTGLGDGGEYGCRLMSQGSLYAADVVVIENPKLTGSNLIFEEDDVRLQCIVSFGSRSLNELAASHTPKLTIYAAGNLITDNYHDPITEGPSEDDGSFTITSAVKYKAKAEDNGYNFICEVGTTNPQYVDRTAKKIDVKFAVRDIVIEPVKTIYYVGESVRCAASGNPVPDYTWSAIASPGAHPVSDALLIIEEQMIGENTWKCTAKNDARQTEIIEDEIQFQVYAQKDKPTTGGSADNSNGTLISDGRSAMLAASATTAVLGIALCYVMT